MLTATETTRRGDIEQIECDVLYDAGDDLSIDPLLALEPQAALFETPKELNRFERLMHSRFDAE